MKKLNWTVKKKMLKRIKITTYLNQMNFHMYNLLRRLMIIQLSQKYVIISNLIESRISVMLFKWCSIRQYYFGDKCLLVY